MKQVLLVFLGGGAGSVLRFLISKGLNPLTNIPIGTLTVNFLGSLLIGVILGMGMKENVLSGNATLLLATGFCGGFTTFSAFSFENQELLRAGDYFGFGIYAAGSIFLGLGAVIAGLYAARYI